MCVRVIGLEPTRLTAPDPKSGAAANYATPATVFACSAGKGKKYFLFFQLFPLLVSHSPHPLPTLPGFMCPFPVLGTLVPRVGNARFQRMVTLVSYNGNGRFFIGGTD